MPIDRLLARLFVVAASSASLAACATAYGPDGINGGYSDTPIAGNVFLIGFKGNVRLSQAETNEMALLHAAEVTLKNGFGYFASSGAASTGSALGMPTAALSVPATTMTITCFVERPATSVTIYDARALVSSLGAKYLK